MRSIILPYCRIGIAILCFMIAGGSFTYGLARWRLIQSLVVKHLSYVKLARKDFVVVGQTNDQTVSFIGYGARDPFQGLQKRIAMSGDGGLGPSLACLWSLVGGVALLSGLFCLAALAPDIIGKRSRFRIAALVGILVLVFLFGCVSL